MRGNPSEPPDPRSADERAERIWALYRANPADSQPDKRLPTLRSLWMIYRSHLRQHPLRELFAVLGVAAGVALLFAVQVANRSITGSFAELSRGIAGRASLEVAARAPDGFDQSLFGKVRRLRSVDAAAPILERRIAVKGPSGRRPLTLVGADERLGLLGGRLVYRYTRRGQGISDPGLRLTEKTAEAIGVRAGQRIEVEVGERLLKLPVASILTERAIGDLTQSPVALAHLGFVQRIARLKGRISRILIAPKAGHKAEAQAELQRLAEGKLNVRPATTEAKLLEQAAAPDRQSTALFAAISLIVGLLLAYNAMLLSLADRRSQIANLHAAWGWSKAKLLATIAFDALVVGLAGAILGLVLGDQLSRHVLHQVPGFLSAAFAIGGQRVIPKEVVAISFAAGILAALAAAARPAVELLRMPSFGASFAEHDRSLGERRAIRGRRRLLWLGTLLIAGSIAVQLAAPETNLILSGVVVLGMVMTLPALVAYLLTAARRTVQRTDSTAGRIAIAELSITPTRATALAATGALAVYAILAIAGPARDIKRGGEQQSTERFANADLWITGGEEESFYLTDRFDAEQAVRRIRPLPQVRSVRLARGWFLDLPDRRILIVAPPANDRAPIGPSDLVSGDPARAKRLLRRGGWAALTTRLAEDLDVRIGEPFQLPMPTGRRQLRLAATVHNFGWFPGTALMSSEDARRLGGTEQASVVEVGLKGGVSPAKGQEAVRAVLGEASALKVSTAADRHALTDSVVSQGLARLNQIANIVAAAVVLAVAAAMLGATFQRRKRLWSLVSIGIRGRRIYTAVFFETALILLIGCLIGAAFGLVGQGLGSRWLEITTGSPAPFEPAFGLALKTLALITALSVAATVVPVRLAFPVTRRVVFSPE